MWCLRFVTSTLCAATFSNSYVKWRLLYVMLRFVAVPTKYLLFFHLLCVRGGGEGLLASYSSSLLKGDSCIHAFFTLQLIKKLGGGDFPHIYWEFWREPVPDLYTKCTLYSVYNIRGKLSAYVRKCANVNHLWGNLSSKWLHSRFLSYFSFSQQCWKVFGFIDPWA